MGQPEDLSTRTERFAREVRQLVREAPRPVCNREDIKQLVRSSGSVAANFIEADDALGPKDKLMRFRICRKEAKESRLWLSLPETAQPERDLLVNEAKELRAIFSSVILKLGG